MTKLFTRVFLALLFLGVLSSCGKKEVVEVPPGDPLVYLDVVNAVASSFDETPDWAPLPNPMAPVDRNILTRWSPKLGFDNEWIYFDLGKVKVLSKIIIKWEQAFATEYEILTSKDEESWRRLLLKRNGTGGTESLVFPALRARYVKIIGLKRVKDTWGFSMWEFEMYGPRSLNPNERSVDETEKLLKKEKEKIENALEEAKAPLTPMTPTEFHRGACYTSWMYDELQTPASDKMLIHMKGVGIGHLAVVVPTYQEDITSETIYVDDHKDADTPSVASIEHAIGIAHKLGMKVMLKPHVDCRDDTPRMEIVASDKWFDSYEEMVLRYARLAEKNKVELFSVGTELEGTTFSRWEARWRQVVEKVRAVYSGYLVYSANWTEYKSVPFWDMMDFIGIDAYFPLADNMNPDQDELIKEWERIASEIEEWLNEIELDKGIIFTEVGYPSSDGAAQKPWAQFTKEEDQKEQSDCYEAVLSVMCRKAYFRGMYIWQYLPQDRWSPLGFTIKDKLAESILSEWYKKKELGGK